MANNGQEGTNCGTPVGQTVDSELRFSGKAPSLLLILILLLAFWVRKKPAAVAAGIVGRVAGTTHLGLLTPRHNLI